MIRIVAPTLRAMGLLAATPVIAVACTSAVSQAPTDAATSADTTASSATAASAPASSSARQPAPDGGATAPEGETMASASETVAPEGETARAQAATWLDIELTDAASGETFTLASLAGEVVAIEPMAIWCTTCKEQQDNVKRAFSDIEAFGVRYVSLGIDPNEDPEALAAYAERRGYGWTFVQSPREFSRALNDLFGPQILSPPSTPLIVLDATGEVVLQDFGFHGPESLVRIFEEATA